MEMDPESSSAPQKSSSDLKKNNMLHQSLDLIMLIISTNKASVNNLTFPEILALNLHIHACSSKSYRRKNGGKIFNNVEGIFVMHLISHKVSRYIKFKTF